MPDGLALFVGAAIILFFSYERFNRTTHEGGRRLERVVSLLSPNKLRARRIVLRAYGFYALALIVIYLFMCAYAELLPMIGGPELDVSSMGASDIPVVALVETAPTTGFDPDSAETAQQLSGIEAPETEGNRLGIDPSISLTVALIIVGLAPSFPALQSVETWMRVSAHRLAGIPTWIVGLSEDLGRNAMRLHGEEDAVVPADTLLIPKGAWERLVHYRRVADAHLTAPEDFRQNMELLLAARSWVLDRKLKLFNSSEQRSFEPLEEHLDQRIVELLRKLDDKSAFRSSRAGNERTRSTEAEAGIDEGETPIEMVRESWERLASEASELAQDICILLALYVEHEIIVPETVGAAAGIGQQGIARQRALARQKLQVFLGETLADRMASGGRPLSAIAVWGWTVAVITGVTVLWSLSFGRFETELQFGSANNGYLRLINYVLGAFNQYAIPMLVALSLRDGALRANRWNNVWTVHWTVHLPQTALVILLSWAFSAIIIVGLGLWGAGLDTGWDRTGAEVWRTLRATFEYNAPTAFRGAVLAWLVTCLLDAQPGAWVRDQRQVRDLRAPVGSSLGWGLASGVVMALCGGVTRYLTSWAAASNAIPPRLALDAIDRGLVFYATILAALIGFSVMTCLAEALKQHRRNGPADSTMTGPAEASVSAVPARK